MIYNNVHSLDGTHAYVHNACINIATMHHLVLLLQPLQVSPHTLPAAFIDFGFV